MARRGEAAIQRDIIKWLRVQGFFVAHVPNGAHLAGNATERGTRARVLIANGMTVGFPDLVVIGRRYGPSFGQIGFIEVKSHNGKLSAQQLTIMDEILCRGHNWCEARGIDDVRRALEEWGWLP